MPLLHSKSKDQFDRYYRNIETFANTILCGEINEPDDYIPGSVRVEFFEEKLTRDRIQVEDYRDEVDEYGGLSYEEALYKRLFSNTNFSLLVLIGGLGSGKTTTIRHLQALFDRRKKQIDDEHSCNCNPCLRKPLYIDNLDIRRRISPDSAIVTVLESIRFELYEKLISEWLISINLSPKKVKGFDGAFKVLRRLMIVNDLQLWADSTSPQDFPLALEVAECRTDPLFNRDNISLEDLRALVLEFRPKLSELAERIDTIKSRPETALDFTELLLGFYISLCSTNKPSNLLIVDNLDELPTETIERVAEELSYLGSVEGIRILLPLRPSSITRNGFERRPNYMYHYGPDCFELILHRIQKYVLNRSLSALQKIEDDGLPKIFESKPTREEIFSLLTATYIYGKIVTAGLSEASIRISDGSSTLPKLHEDFRNHLQQLRISEGGIRSLSETLGALVGTCGRYATEQLERYLKGVYLRSRVLEKALRKGISKGAAKQLYFGYSQMISTILIHQPGAVAPERLANLYRPSRVDANPNWPSLVKIRILDKVRYEGRVEATAVLRSLSQFGIPKELSILAANDLHIKQRLLIWFSKNTELTTSDSDLAQDIVISEHGLNYLRYVLGDFEYIWFCATEIPPGSSDSAQNFKERLKEYRRLLDAFFRTEWKQQAFLKCSRSRATDESDVSTSRRMLSLSILYSSLERAISSSRISLSLARTGSDYHEDLVSLVVEIAALIIQVQDAYRLCYGENSYLLVYSNEIEEARKSLRRLENSNAFNENLDPALTTLKNSWEETPSALKQIDPEIEKSLPPKEDFVTLCAKYGRGLIPGVQAYAETVDKMEAQKIYFWEFMRAREKLANHLENRLPDYSIVQRYLGFVLDDAERLIETSDEIAATGSETLRWIIKEESWLRARYDQLGENRYSVNAPISYERMDDLKGRFNNIINVMERVARRLGGEKSDHLSCRWH